MAEEKVTGRWFSFGAHALEVLHGREAVLTREQARAFFGDPECPKRCDVATPPEVVRSGVFACTGCGTEFAWPRRAGA